MATVQLPLAATTTRSVARWVAAVIALVGAIALGVVAGSEPIVAVAAAVVALVGVAIAVKPDTATLVVIALLYSNAAVIAVNFWNLPYTVGSSFPILLLAPLAYLVLVRRQPLVITTGLLWALAFLVANIVATILSPNFATSFTELRQLLLEGIVLYFLLTNAIRTTDLLRSVIWVVVLIAAGLSALSVYQQLSETYFNDYFGFAQVTQNNDGFTVSERGFFGTVTQRRLGGPIGEENRYAQILLCVLPLAVFCAVTERRGVLRAAGAACALVITFGIALTFSRGAAVGFVVLAVAMLLLRLIRIRHLLVLAVGVGLVFAIVPSYLVRISTLEAIPAITSSGSGETADTSVTSRGTENLAAFLIAADHPIVGVGPGMYPDFYQRYAERVQDYSNTVDVRHKNTRRQAHNFYLGVLAETGVLGLGALLGLLGATLLQLFRVRRRQVRARPELANLASAFIASILAYMVTGIFLHLSYQRYFWLVMALAGVGAIVAARAGAEAATLEPGEPAVPFWRAQGTKRRHRRGRYTPLNTPARARA